jgi:hypothetical protein
VEALKRFRNPELAALFHTLLDHPDWHIQHRGLLALERYPADVGLERAWRFLQHPERRIREKAAITCIKLWDGREAPGDLDLLIREEQEYHVRRCLEALAERVKGTLHVERLAEEHVHALDNGLLLAPFLGDMKLIATAAPGYQAVPVQKQGKGSASRHKPADRWTTPLMAYGEEEVPVPQLEPFANLRQDDSVYHAGHDVGACMDGAGIYAPAAGVVMFVGAGTEMGTQIAVEHHLPGGRLITGIYMHAGDTVFAAPGDTVACGQLLGTVGTSFTIENGGHFSHLHYGIYPGKFDPRHNYANKPVSAGLADWYDPAEFLPAWAERTKPVVPDLFPPSDALVSAVRKANKGDYARAYAEALKLRDRAERRSDAWADADEVVQAVRQASRNGLRRAEALVDGGYPREAQKFIEKLFSACKGMPGAEKLEKQLEAWKDDSSFKLAVKGQSKVEAVEKKAPKERDPEKLRKMWEKLLDDFGRTCLANRIQEQLDRLDRRR